MTTKFSHLCNMLMQCIIVIQIAAQIAPKVVLVNANIQKFHPQCTDNQYYQYSDKFQNASPSSSFSSPQSSSSSLQRHKQKSCEWVKEDPETRCSLIDKDDIKVKDRCRASCDNCKATNSGTSVSISSINPVSAKNKTNIKRRNLEKQKVGAFCLSDSDCQSWLCRENTCFASEECKSIKHIPGQEFHENLINLVFVGSGFEDIELWRKTVAKTFMAFDQFEFFSFSNPRYNAFYVDELSEQNFCNFNCEGIENLLCCDVRQAKKLANKCFPTGSQLQTIVIENDDQYGGGGYRYQNMATTSTHDYGPIVAVHELGHSLFELGDEYVNSRFTTRTAPNCDVEGCPRWADLNEHMGGGLCEMKGCQNGNYFVGENSFMRELNAPMGHVNLRYTCCTFLALTKGIPSYCQIYEFGNGLLDYCQKDYQKYGGPDVYVDGRSTYNDHSKHVGKFIVAEKPVRLSIDLTDSSFTYANAADIDNQGPSLVLRREYLGDFPNIRAVCDSHLRNITVITLEFDTGEIHKLYFTLGDSVELPPAESLSLEEEIDVIVESTIIEIVVDAQKGLVIDLQVENLEITIWFRLKTWISGFLNGIFGWLFSGTDDSNLLIQR